MNTNDKFDALVDDQKIPVSAFTSLLMRQTSVLGLGLKELDGRYRIANKTLDDLLGRDGKPIVGLSDAQLFDDDVAQRLRHWDQRIIDEGTVASDTLELAVDGVTSRCLWLEFPIVDADDTIISVGVLTCDVSHLTAIAEMRTAMAELSRMAREDKLTGAWNRRRLEEAVAAEMDRLRRFNHALSLILIDIDFFKSINDRFGHGAGDQVLVELAAAIRSCLRVSDSLTRWGGEEFVVLCPNTTLSTVAFLAKRLRETIAEAVIVEGQHVTVSIGLAECLPEEDWTSWFERADAALYRAKSGGRNQVQVAPETPGHADIGEKVTVGFAQINWRPAYECGHALIDNEHRDLFAAANGLVEATLSGRPKTELTDLSDALLRDVIQHFHDEEAVLVAAGYPGATEHAAIHRRLTERAVSLLRGFVFKNVDIGELFKFLAHELIARHLLETDRAFFPYLREQG
jgi:diguanylate cyclase (GGDEF)-like protein/hemerythrin-like metal-binding protein